MPLLTLVLGVHRSGTSLLTLGLRALGADLGGAAEERDADNPDGYAEHAGVRDLNDRLLAHLGASWDNWGFRAGQVDWDAPDLAPWRAEAVALLREAFAGDGPFVLKDPRITSLVPFWDRVVPEAGLDLRRLLILRDPAEVSESQRQRVARGHHDFPVIAEAEPMAALWAVTMAECLAALPDDATLLVGHAGLLADPVPTLAAAAAFAGLAPDPDAVARFAAEGVRPALHRARAGTDEVGPCLLAARALFDDLARDGLPRRLHAAEARAMAAAQAGIAALAPVLPAVQASLGRLRATGDALRSRNALLTRVVWHLATPAAAAPGPIRDQALEAMLATVGPTPPEELGLAVVHAVGRLLVRAGRRDEAVAWLGRARPAFGGVEAFDQLEQNASGRPEVS